MSDPAPYPRVGAYLAALPRGVDSYAHCQVKGSVVRQTLEGVAPERFAPPTPTAIASWLREPPPVSSWVPEVHLNVLFLAMADQIFSDEQEFLRHVYGMNRSLLRGPLYRVMMMLVTPAALFRHASDRWRQFHRGVAVRAREIDKRHAEVHMDFPPKLMPPIVARAYVTAFEAAVEAAGGVEPRFDVTSESDEHCAYLGSWR